MVDCKSFKKFRGGIKIKSQDPDTSYPSNPVKGSLYYDSNDSKLYVYDAAAWKSVTDFGSADLSDSIDAINLTTEDTRDLISYDSGTSKWINRAVDEFSPELMGVSTRFEKIHDMDGNATSPVGGNYNSRFMPVAADPTYATTYSANLCGSTYFNTIAGASSYRAIGFWGGIYYAGISTPVDLTTPTFGDGAEQLGGRSLNQWDNEAYFSPKVAGLYQVDISLAMDEESTADVGSYFEIRVHHTSDWQDYTYRIIRYTYGHADNDDASHNIPGSALLWFHGKEANTKIELTILANTSDYQNINANAMSSFTLIVPTGRGP